MTLYIPPTTTREHVLAALDHLATHAPEALSSEGRAFLDAEAARIRDRDARHHANYAAHQEAAMQRAFPGTSKKD